MRRPGSVTAAGGKCSAARDARRGRSSEECYIYARAWIHTIFGITRRGGSLAPISVLKAHESGGARSGKGRILTRLRLRDFELLLAIHEHKSITSAALQLGFTQPAASRALKDMEQLLRAHLFERDRTKGMNLTAAGALVLTRARALLADLGSMTKELDAYRAGTGGHVRLGIIPFVPGLLIEKLISELIGEKHQMSVSLTEGSTTQLLEDLRMQKLDAVIGRCSTGPIPAGLTEETLFRQEACLLVHGQNPLVRKERIRLADLGGSSGCCRRRARPVEWPSTRYSRRRDFRRRSPPSKRGRPKSFTSRSAQTAGCWASFLRTWGTTSSASVAYAI
jgi:DNA-binding transcriptional LysR family regulator